MSMNKSLIRNLGFWLLLAASVASTTFGTLITTGQLGMMTAKLLDNTAVAVDVYVGQSRVVVGAVLLGVGVLGILLVLTLIAAKSLVQPAAPVGATPIDAASALVEPLAAPDASDVLLVQEADAEDQNGNSGSIATATKISVK